MTKTLGLLFLALLAAAAYWRDDLMEIGGPYVARAMAATGLSDSGDPRPVAEAPPAPGGGRKTGGGKEGAGGAASGGQSSAGQNAGGQNAGGQNAGGQSAGRRGSGGPASVATVAAVDEPMPRLRKTIGVVASPANLSVTSETQGLVTEVVARDGADVKAGDVLVRLDSRIAEATVAKDRAALARDQASLEHARNVMERQQKLLNRDAVSQQSLEDAATAVATAEATVALDEAVLKADEITLEQKVIRAPFDGRLGAFEAVAGSLVQPSTAIVRLTRLDPLQAAFTLPESDVAVVQAALAAGHPLDVTVAPLGTDRSYKGAIDFVDANVDGPSGSFTVKATLEADAVGKMLPGQSLAVTVTLGVVPATVVPAVALQTTQSGTVVYVVGPDGKIDVRPVTVALTDGARTGLAAGVTAGERVVVEGQMRLAPGMAVVDAGAPGAGKNATRVSDAAGTAADPSAQGNQGQASQGQGNQGQGSQGQGGHKRKETVQ